MNRNDWVGLGTSVALHALVLLLLAFLAAATPEPEQLGFVEVELGSFSEGRPVQRAVETAPRQEPTRQQQPKPQQAQARPTPPKESKPVRLPKPPADVPDPEKVRTPKTEQVSPETRDNTDRVPRTEPKEEAQPAKETSGGARDGTSGAADGAQGTGAEETKAAPYLIEGLNRSIVSAPAPSYPEKVNADIKFRITVNARGQVVSAIPVLKANAALERAARDVMLRRWQFNPLPGDAPTQTGFVTFRFRLE